MCVVCLCACGCVCVHVCVYGGVGGDELGVSEPLNAENTSPAILCVLLWPQSQKSWEGVYREEWDFEGQFFITNSFILAS